MKTIQMPAPQWRTVLTWMTAIIQDHTKVSWERKNINGVIPSHGVYDVLKDMAKAADAARELQEENELLRAELKQLKNMGKYIGKKVLWSQDYRDGQPREIITIHSICFNGGFDNLDEPVFFNKSKDRYMTLDYVKKYIIKDK